MNEHSPAEMDGDERDEFLGTGGTGVISFSTDEDEPPHSVPVSYGYDATESTFYFRVSVGPDSEKGELAARPASFVVFQHDEDRWRSVVAKGRLEDISEDSVGTDALAGIQRVDIPLVDMFDVPTREVPFEFVRLVPDELTGRVESSTEV